MRVTYVCKIWNTSSAFLKAGNVLRLFSMTSLKSYKISSLLSLGWIIYICGKGQSNLIQNRIDFSECILRNDGICINVDIKHIKSSFCLRKWILIYSFLSYKIFLVQKSFTYEHVDDFIFINKVKYCWNLAVIKTCKNFRYCLIKNI